jgi:hypothetical protein
MFYVIQNDFDEFMRFVIASSPEEAIQLAKNSVTEEQKQEVIDNYHNRNEYFKCSLNDSVKMYEGFIQRENERLATLLEKEQNIKNPKGNGGWFEKFFPPEIDKYQVDAIESQIQCCRGDISYYSDRLAAAKRELESASDDNVTFDINDYSWYVLETFDSETPVQYVENLTY